MVTNNSDNVYIPGVCNIGKKEIGKRRNSAIVSGILAIALGAGILITHSNPLLRLLVFFPLVSFTVGIQQWVSKFCVNFGMRGLFNFNDLGRQETIDQLEMRKADRSRALKMIITGVLSALLLSIAFYLI
jgi:hypothetical protein